jgi:precorrin-6B methylase 2
MLPANLNESEIYDHVRQLLLDHEKMLADAARNRAFYEALRRRVGPGSVVLDIGAGPGVWAIAAARLGAKRVVAIDSNELLLGVIKRLARECGVGDRVRPVFGYSTQAQLDKEFDVVVSETIGWDGFDENIVGIMADARRRFLKPGGALIPETVSLRAAAAHFKGYGDAQPDGLPFDFPYFTALKYHSPARLARKSDLRLLTKPRRLLEANLYEAEPSNLPGNLNANWELAGDEAVNCVAVWVESRLARGVKFSTRRTTSWMPVVYRVAPPSRRAAKLEFNLSFAASHVSWAAAFSGDGWRESRRYSPAEATKQILLDLDDCGETVSETGQTLIAELTKDSSTSII